MGIFSHRRPSHGHFFARQAVCLALNMCIHLGSFPDEIRKPGLLHFNHKGTAHSTYISIRYLVLYRKQAAARPACFTAAVVGFAGIGKTDPLSKLANDPAPFLTLAQHYIPWFAVIAAIIGVTSYLGLYLAAINSNARITFCVNKICRQFASADTLPFLNQGSDIWMVISG